MKKVFMLLFFVMCGCVSKYPKGCDYKGSDYFGLIPYKHYYNCPFGYEEKTTDKKLEGKK